MPTTAHARRPFYDDDEDRDVLIQFEDNALEPLSVVPENFDAQVREAQEQLAILRQREEELERQQRELEELKQRKEAFINGRDQLKDELKRALAALDREADESQRRADDCVNTRQTLEHALRSIESLRPDTWNKAQVRHEMIHAQTQLGEAEEELSNATPLLQSIRGGRKVQKAASPKAESDQQGFLYWFRSGLAFTLPIMIFAAIFGLFFLIFGGA